MGICLLVLGSRLFVDVSVLVRVLGWNCSVDRLGMWVRLVR